MTRPASRSARSPRASGPVHREAYGPSRARHIPVRRVERSWPDSSSAWRLWTKYAVELFAASLATCVAFHAGRYLLRHGLHRTGLRVRMEFTMACDRPARVASIRLTITPPPGLSQQRHAALLAVASHCTVPSWMECASAPRTVPFVA
ncbi:OsmC family protein [Streptomyces sp. ID05-04B]|uniref:OsmC family protein n=1 Tax=unclassified Streptomyces TaxID=2593676 RepID=UPI000D1B478C|nr:MULTISPECIES: OsmC family protein [unclassified Streptomyces]AVV44638.1 hypothetical protein C6376_27575 [Streptomyces sp. P3]MDX5568257.1 OsmC family protein [Streptomyces sp. ID05-04B]